MRDAAVSRVTRPLPPADAVEFEEFTRKVARGALDGLGLDRSEVAMALGLKVEDLDPWLAGDLSIRGGAP